MLTTIVATLSRMTREATYVTRKQRRAKWGCQDLWMQRTWFLLATHISQWCSQGTGHSRTCPGPLHLSDASFPLCFVDKSSVGGSISAPFASLGPSLFTSPPSFWNAPTVLEDILWISVVCSCFLRDTLSSWFIAMPFKRANWQDLQSHRCKVYISRKWD